MKVIMAPNPNPPHNLRKTTPAYGGREFVGWTEAEVLDHVIARLHATGLIPDGTDYYVVDGADLPEDEYFFDAWEWVDTKVSVNMSKAREIHIGKIRESRDAQLLKEDVTMLRAIEAGDTVAQATTAATKQALRDLPQTFDLSTRTPAQLKGRWPEELPPRPS